MRRIGQASDDIIGECKYGWRHAWYPGTTQARPREGDSYDIVGVCERCGTERVGRCNSDGTLIGGGWRYIYPNDTQYKAVRFESVSEWRAMYIDKLARQAKKEESEAKITARVRKKAG